MEANELIGKKATIVGLSETGAKLDNGTEFVAHICLDIEDGPRVFFQATGHNGTICLVEEQR